MYPPRGWDAGREVLLLSQRVEPVAVDAGDDGCARTRRRAPASPPHHPAPAAPPRPGRPTPPRPPHHAPAASDVVAVHRLGRRDVAAGIEPRGQLVGMVVQVGLDGVPAPRPRIFIALGRRPKRAASSGSLR
jgi:hypothetical protein